MRKGDENLMDTSLVDLIEKEFDDYYSDKSKDLNSVC